MWPAGGNSQMSRSVIDLDELMARVENDRDLMRDLMLIFKEEFPRHEEALREAVASQDASGVVGAAHTLKGMLSEAAAAAACLEQLGRDGEITKLGEPLAQFEKIAEELTRQIDLCLAEVSA